METFRELKQVILSCLRMYMGKALFALFMLMMLQTVVVSFFMMALRPGQAGASVHSLLMTAVPLYAAFTAILMLQYGFHVLMARFLRRQYATIGYLFIGFRNTRRVLKACALYAAGLETAFVLCQLITTLFRARLTAFVQAAGVLVFGVCMLGVFCVFAVLLLARFSFVWLCLYDEPQLPVSACFRKSAGLLKNHTIRFVAFVLYAGGWHLVTAAVMFLLSIVFPALVHNSTSGALVFVFEFVYLVAMYTAVIRMYLAVPVFYESLGARRDALPPAQSDPSDQ